MEVFNKMNRSKVWMNIRESFWFIPAVYGITAIIVVLLINFADAWLISSFKDDIPKQVLTGKDTAKKLYATLVTAILTMTTISFSVIMVVLTTYSSQFSPRVLQDFMKSKFTQHILGIFSSGFIFALIFLLLIDSGEPLFGPILMTIIAIICLGSFVYFIHHSSRWLQVNRLTEMLKAQGIKTIRNVYQKHHTYVEYSTWDEEEIVTLKEKSYKILRAEDSGYIERINWQGIVDYAKKYDYVIDFHVQVGNYIPKNFPLMSVMDANEIKAEDHLHSLIIIGKERTDIQDIEFVIQKIVDIALRAISPSTNDPHTAINSINRIGGLLIEVGKNYKESSYLTDSEENLRVALSSRNYEDYLYKSFYQLRYYGSGDVSVIYGILEVLYKISDVSDSMIKRKIWDFHYYISESIGWDKLSSLDREHLQEIYDKLESSCNKKAIL